ncbi:MAG: hypothetical protein CMH31_00180 [Micavibrio sp.]|nr:hypothetical protein [Micavibrio sp.]
MALNDIALCSRALIRIGAAPITSFNDGSAESEIAGALYETLRNSILSSYPWTFATGQVELTQLSISPTADYQYAYQLPNDFLRAISAGSSAESQGVKYRISRDQLHTDYESVVLSYIFNPDEAETPPFFDMVLITRLAAEFCIPVTENTSRAEVMFRIANKEFAQARSIDAMQDTPNKIQDFSLIDVRD